MSVKEVPTILRKIAWSMRRADGDELKWLEEIKVKVVRYNKLGQRDTDKLQFSEAFKYYRNCNHDTFTWNGISYTTILKSEINQDTEKNHESINNIDLVIK